jgi:hypothetical protein
MEGLSGLFVVNSVWQTFLWGFAGSLAVEVVALYRQYNLDIRIPTRYSRPFYWIIRVLLAVVGGGLAVAYGIGGNPLLAANVGAATPLIVQALSQGVRESA